MADTTDNSPTRAAQFLPQENTPFSFSWAALILGGATGILTALFLFVQIHRIENENNQSEFFLLAEHNDFVMQEELNSLILNLKYAGALYSLVPKKSDSEFATFLSPYKTTKSYLQKINWHALPVDFHTKSTQYQASVQIALHEKRLVPYFPPPATDPSEDFLIDLILPIADLTTEKFVGLINATINFSELIRSGLSPEYAESANIYFFQHQDRLLYFFNAEQKPRKTLAPSPQGLTNTQKIFLGDATLTVIYEATPSYTAHTWQATIAAAITLLITGLIVITASTLMRLEKKQFSHLLHEEQTHQTKEVIDLLEITKTRLAAQENLASLGGLTAGIAHEIKNPLNFINNFSTLSIDLIRDIDVFLTKYQQVGTDKERQEIQQSLLTLKENMGTIHTQGVRANTIVQRMLAHSRGKPGEWGQHDIHKLLNECIDLAYQEMCNKNPNFYVSIEKTFDPHVKEIEIVENDISRAFLNLLSNAFQSIEEKQKRLGSTYKHPTVTLKTEKVGHFLRIQVRDNGLGISEANQGNLFTPFFTTKPAGSGTGLGLSISYNIIVREHQGSLTFHSAENEYCEFTMTLPLERKKEVTHL